MATATLNLITDASQTLQGSGKVYATVELSAIANNLYKGLPAGTKITKITLNFSGSAYNNGILYSANEYVHCALTNDGSEIASDTSGGSGDCTNLFKQGAYRINAKSTTTLTTQAVDITKYFASESPFSVQNTSYTLLGVAFTSKSTYKKTYTYSMSLTIECEVFTNNIYIGTSQASAVYVNTSTKTITFVTSGTISLGATGADTVDGYHIALSNTAPSSGTQVSAIYVGTTKVYG